MSFLLRLLNVMFWAVFGKRQAFAEPSKLFVRVWPNDLDLNIHMNNGRYLTLMDLGRMDLMLRNGAMKLWFSKGWQPLVAFSACRHFKALRCFQLFELRTTILGWDEKWIYFEQRFMRGQDLYALGVVKALMAGKQGPVPTETIFKELGLQEQFKQSPALPEWVTTWLQSEKQVITKLKAERGQA